MNSFEFAMAENSTFPELVNEYFTVVSRVNEMSSKMMRTNFGDAAEQIKTIIDKVNILDNEVFEYLQENNNDNCKVIGNTRILNVSPSAELMKKALSTMRVALEDDHSMYLKLDRKAKGGKYSLFEYNSDNKKRNKDFNAFYNDFETFVNKQNSYEIF